MQEETLSEITWKAPEHRHTQKNADWYWILGIIATATAVVSILFQNTLFGIVILLGSITIMLFSYRKPKLISFGVSSRGVLVGDSLYPFATLESFFIDENLPDGPQLLIKSKRVFMPLIIFPIPADHVDDIESLIAIRIPEEHLEEPFAHRLLEYFGF